MKVIIDTNICIPFLIGHQLQTVRRILTDLRFDVYVCDRLIDEIRDVASRDKIRKRITANDIKDLLAIIQAFCKFAVIKAEVNPSIIRDHKDLYLLELAQTIGADYIVSGDIDLTIIGQHHNTRVLKLADFKAMMLLG